MKNQKEIMVADLRDLRLMQVAAAQQALADDDPDRCIRCLKNIMGTVRDDSRKEMEKAMEESDAYQHKIDNAIGNLMLFGKKDMSPFAQMFYDKMMDIILRYALIKD